MTHSNLTSTTRTTLHYGWVVVAVTFVVLLVSAGVRAVPAILMLPLEQEFGWPRTTTSFAVSINLLFYGVAGPFAGSLMVRVGIRKVVIAALVLLGVAVAAATFVREPWQVVVVWGLGIGTGTGLLALVLAATVVNRWFVARRGIVLGVLTSSVAMGQLVFLPLLSQITARSGWRSAVIVVAVIVAALVPIVAWLLRETPASMGLRPYGEESPAPVVETATSLGAIAVLGEVRRSHNFWILFATFFICGASTNGLIGSHLIPAAHDHGIPETRAASMLALMGVCNLLGTTASGWLSDRWDSRYLLAAYYGLRGFSLLFLPTALAGANPAILTFAVWYGLDWIATVPPTLRLANEAFGRVAAPIVFGWVSVGHQIGAASIALLAGSIRVSTGRYDVAFFGAGLICLFAATLSLAFRRPATSVPRESFHLQPPLGAGEVAS